MLRVQDSGFRIQSLMVQDSGFRVQGLGVRGEGVREGPAEEAEGDGH